MYMYTASSKICSDRLQSGRPHVEGYGRFAPGGHHPPPALPSPISFSPSRCLPQTLSLCISLSPAISLTRSLSLSLFLAMSLSRSLSLTLSILLALVLSLSLPLFRSDSPCPSHSGVTRVGYRGTWLIRNHPTLGTYSRPVRRALWWS